MTRTRLIAPLFMAVVVGFTPMPSHAEAQAEARPALTEFDDAVTRSRLLMRQYCAIAQEMASASEPDASRQARALQALRDARVRWTVIQEKYSARPPAEYARDKDFGGRLQDIADAMSDMERALIAGQARHSSRACGYGCGLFVAMHEDNSLSYPLDKLFHLRKDLKNAQALMSTHGVTAVQGRLAALLGRRDVVLATPPRVAASDSRLAPYTTAVLDMSRAFDEVALAAAAGDTTRTDAGLARASTLANKAYGMALELDLAVDAPIHTAGTHPPRSDGRLMVGRRSRPGLGEPPDR